MLLLLLRLSNQTKPNQHRQVEIYSGVYSIDDEYFSPKGRVVRLYALRPHLHHQAARTRKGMVRLVRVVLASHHVEQVSR